MISVIVLPPFVMCVHAYYYNTLKRYIIFLLYLTQAESTIRSFPPSLSLTMTSLLICSTPCPRFPFIFIAHLFFDYLVRISLLDQCPKRRNPFRFPGYIRYSYIYSHKYSFLMLSDLATSHAAFTLAFLFLQLSFLFLFFYPAPNTPFYTSSQASWQFYETSLSPLMALFLSHNITVASHHSHLRTYNPIIATSYTIHPLSCITRLKYLNFSSRSPIFTLWSFTFTSTVIFLNLSFENSVLALFIFNQFSDCQI